MTIQKINRPIYENNVKKINEVIDRVNQLEADSDATLLTTVGELNERVENLEEYTNDRTDRLDNRLTVLEEEAGSNVAVDIDSIDTDSISDYFFLVLEDYAKNHLTVKEIYNGENDDIHPYNYQETEFSSMQLSELTDAIVTGSADRAFSGCSYMNSLDGVESTWDMSQVTSMKGMLAGCRLRYLNLTSWDTSNVTNMESLFQDATYEGWTTSNFSFLDLANWDTSNVTNMDNMFDFNNLVSVLDLSNFSTENLEEPPNLFGTHGYVKHIIIDSTDFKFQGCQWPQYGFYWDEIYIYVPRSMLSTYRNAPGWADYAEYFYPIDNFYFERIIDGINAGGMRIYAPEIL